jgi:hypothetical protein
MVPWQDITGRVVKTDPIPLVKTDPIPLVKTDPILLVKTDPIPLDKTDPIHLAIGGFSDFYRGGNPAFIVEPESWLSYGQIPYEVRLQRVTPCLACLNIDGTVAGPNGSSFQDGSSSSGNRRVL